MLKAALWTLRQRRYASLAVLMVAIAALCVLAGTWQISRFEQSVRDNNAMRANARHAAVTLSTSLVPLAGHGTAPGRDAIRYQTVTATGSYLPVRPQFLANEQVAGVDGFYVVSPLRTSAGVLLVVRGFVPEDNNGNPPATLPALPSGPVTVTGQLQTTGSTNERAEGQLIVAINPAQQAARLGQPVYLTYATLNAGAPGTSGLTALPAPDLSNPAGGAVEPQHFAYIIQWYLFALLALAAPFAMARSEVREAQRRFLGIDAGSEQIDAIAVGDLPPLAALPGGSSAGGSSAGGTVALRDAGELAVRGVTVAEWEAAKRLADRYGRSLVMGDGGPESLPKTAASLRRFIGAGGPGRDSRNAAPHRADDQYVGQYNDYLWELALADGVTPDVAVPGGRPPGPAAMLAGQPPERRPPQQSPPADAD